MSARKENGKPEISRRELLKLSGLALGGLALGGVTGGARADDTPADDPGSVCHRPSAYPPDQYSYFFGGNGQEGLDLFNPNTELEPNEMRISFMGSTVPQFGRAQAYMSIFVEVGWVQDEYLLKKDPPELKYKAQDQFIFDCGTGCTANYSAMNVKFNRMDKVFLNHLHADHMSDLSTIYTFGCSSDRKSPLFVFGPSPSGVRSPKPPRRLYDDGTKAFCRNLREAMRWHSESFSFQPTAYESYEPPTRHSWGLPCDPRPVGDDSIDDSYAMVPIELDWTKYGKRPGDNVAYHNRKTGVKITHFPVIHCRKGSIGYKLEWTTPDGTPMTMVYTSDTKPETMSIEQAKNYGPRGVAKGVDVFIHEMAIPPEIWSMKNLGLTSPPEDDPDWEESVKKFEDVQNSSHTTQGAFGFLLSQIEPRPRLTVATHFPTTDDNVACALESVRSHVSDVVVDKNNGNLVWSYDCMVLRVFPDRIEQLRADVSDYTYAAYPAYTRYDILPPKYATSTDQLELSTEIPPTDPDTGEYHYNSDGY